MRDLLIATNNLGKLREFKEIVGELPIKLITLRQLGIETDIAETGSTFAENARLKAVGYARLAGMATLADDSGLVVDSLDGRPGVYSARYAGTGANDRDRVQKLLDEMNEATDRTARFVCFAALADAEGHVFASVEGKCEGTITNVSRGSSGFGYDPIFLPNGYDKTFAELDPAIKNRISHRGDAFSKMLPFLRGFFDI
jgi:XTP/dITP diphosphohydrolase